VVRRCPPVGRGDDSAELGLSLCRLPGLSPSSTVQGTPDRDPVPTVRWRVCGGVGGCSSAHRSSL